MTTSRENGPALIDNLRRSATELASNEVVSDEQFHRVMGQVGLLICDVAENAVSNEDARALAVEEAERAVAGEKVREIVRAEAARVAGAAVNVHFEDCRTRQASPTTVRGALLIALSKSPSLLAVIIVVVSLRPSVLQFLEKLISP